MRISFIGALCFTVAVLLGGNSVVLGQEPDYRKEPRNEEVPDPSEFKTIGLKTNPISILGGPIWVNLFIPVTGEYRIAAEAVASPHSTVEVGVSYLGPSPIVNLEDQMERMASQQSLDISVNIKGFRLQGRYKWFYLSYFSDDRPPKGLYVAPNLSFARAHLELKEQGVQNPATATLQFDKWNLQLLTGYQMVAEGGFTFDPFAGLGYGVYDISGTSNNGAAGARTVQEDLDQVNGVTARIGFNVGYFF